MRRIKRKGCVDVLPPPPACRSSGENRNSESLFGIEDLDEEPSLPEIFTGNSHHTLEPGNFQLQAEKDETPEAKNPLHGFVEGRGLPPVETSLLGSR